MLMSFDKHRTQPDTPLFMADFQQSAINQGTTKSTGTRLFRDLLFRGRFYDAALQKQAGQPLRLIDRSRLGNLPEEILLIHYFGEQTKNPQAMSLDGLRFIVQQGLVDDIIISKSESYDMRERILDDVVTAKLIEVASVAAASEPSAS